MKTTKLEQEIARRIELNKDKDMSYLYFRSSPNGLDNTDFVYYGSSMIKLLEHLFYFADQDKMFQILVAELFVNLIQSGNKDFYQLFRTIMSAAIEEGIKENTKGTSLADVLGYIDKFNSN